MRGERPIHAWSGGVLNDAIDPTADVAKVRSERAIHAWSGGVFHESLDSMGDVGSMFDEVPARATMKGHHRRVDSPVPMEDVLTPRTPLRQLNLEHCFQPSDSFHGKTGSQLEESELLDILNHAESPEIKQLKHIGEKNARAIIRHRRKGEGELKCVTQLVTKVGLSKTNVTMFMREYDLCD